MSRHLCTKHKPFCRCDPTKCNNNYYNQKRRFRFLSFPERESFFLDHTDKEELTQKQWLTAMRNDLICPYFRREQPSFDGDLTTIAGKRFRSDGTVLAVFCLTWAVLTAFSLLVSLCGTVTIGSIALSFPPEKQGAGIVASAIGFPFFLWLSLSLFRQSSRIVAVTNSHGLYLPCGVFPWKEMREIDFKIGTQHNRYEKEPNTVILIGKDYRVVLVNLPKALLKEARKHKPTLRLTIVSAVTGKRKPLG